MLKIGGLNKLTLLDFPDLLSAEIFLVGCNFRCPFCHNKDLVLNENIHLIDEYYVLNFLKERINKLDGLVISGGEPLIQHNDLIPFLKNVKDLGYKIKLDTNGSFFNELVSLIKMNLVDYVAIDIKNSVSNYHKSIGLNDNNENKKTISNILKSIKFLIDESKLYNIDYELRTTFVKELITKKDIEDILSLIKGASKYYLQEFEDIGTNISNGFSSYSIKELEDIKQLFNNNSIETHIRNN